MHLDSKLAAIRVGDLPGHLYIFLHIKIGQVQVQNSRGHTSNVMPSRVLHSDTEPFLTDSHAAYNPHHCSLPGFSKLPKYTLTFMFLHVSGSDSQLVFFFDSDLPTVI